MTYQITQTMLDVVGEPIETVWIFDNIMGLAFVEVAGGLWRIYNLTTNQCLRGRWNSLEHAKTFAKTRLCSIEHPVAEHTRYR